jgi:anti-sigma factor RsiW
MKHQRTDHLSYDGLLKAVVDPQDLADDLQRHFEHCPQCKHAARRLEQRYTRLGRLARSLTPEPAQAFRVPQKARPVSRWQSKPALAMGLAGALILFVTLWWSPRFNPSQQTPQMTAVNPEQELALMQQVDALVADALPPALQQLASVTESNTSEDLIEWVLPSIDEKEGPDPHASSEAAGSEPMLISGGYLYFGKRGRLC